MKRVWDLAHLAGTMTTGSIHTPHWSSIIQPRQIFAAGTVMSGNLVDRCLTFSSCTTDSRRENSGACFWRVSSSEGEPFRAVAQVNPTAQNTLGLQDSFTFSSHLWR